MKKIIIFLLLVPITAFAQLTDNFEDGDISNWLESNVGRWEASSDNPLNGAYSLHHIFDNSVGDTDQISIALPAIDLSAENINWQFQIKYGYNPSGGNNWSVFLMSDANSLEMLPTGSANGYALGVNYNSSDDKIKLYKIEDGNETVIVNTGIDWQNIVGVSQKVGFEILRTISGDWEVYIDYTGGFDNLELIGTGNNSDYSTADFFGVYYLYTSSADCKLWIDDIYYGKEIFDTILPLVDTLEVLSTKSLLVKFSERVDSASAVGKSNYLVDNGIENPDSVIFDPTNRDRVVLEFNNSFSDGIQNSVDVSNIEDLEGNILSDTTLYFTYEYQKIVKLEVLSLNELSISFLRAVDTVSAQDISNYTVNNSIGNPSMASITELNKVKLKFDTDFVNETNYEIEIKNVADLNGDSMNLSIQQYLYFIPQKYDIVINEIFADPYPQVALPESEYIELFNTTSFAIDITDWSFIAGSSDCKIPEHSIDALGYIILCDINDVDDFSAFSNVIGVSSFPTISNSGALIQLLDTNDIVISEVSYNDTWYQNPEKHDGGWSLEKIDPKNNCSGINNWIASESSIGGTPGAINSVDAINFDNTKPSITFLETVSSSRLKIHLSEPVDETIAQIKTNYFVDNGIGNPQSIIINNIENDIELLFADNFVENATNILSVSNLADLCDNVMDNKDLEFVYHPIDAYDIVINEIMIDPEPVINLPATEYIELFNTSNYDISISNWILEAGSSNADIPSYVLSAGEYLILCDEDSYNLLNIYGNTLAFSGFPSLSNSGSRITLKTDFGKVISNINYTDKWYSDENKDDGGWSIEQIDPMNPCGGIDNWKASEDNKGGTPGMQNSVFAANPDLYAPELIKATMINDSTVKLFFSEPVDSTFATIITSYNVENIGNPDKVIIDSPNNMFVELEFSERFSKNTIYTLEISGDIPDCAGNVMVIGESIRFAIPEMPEEHDLLINEVLFNPLPGGVDFIEIYNNSDKTIDLADINLANIDDDSGDISSSGIVLSEGRLIFPYEYYVLTDNPETVMLQYYTSNSENIVTSDNMPSMNDDEGEVIILDKFFNIIDYMEYNSDMHFALLITEDGVSLERISLTRDASDKSNWHSAAESVGFATPAYKNSQFSENNESNDEITIESEVFSPDNDGYQDNFIINYSFEKPGYVANVKIFDSKGRMIRRLKNNELLATEGSFVWDGLNQEKQKSAIGIYVVYIELFDLDGNVKKYKKTCVVAGKL